MKHLSLLKNIAMACCAVAATAAVSSCNSALSPQKAAQRLQASTDATVFSYNDAEAPRARFCDEAGPLPARASRALAAWLRDSTPKSFSYAYPQYFVSMTNPNGRGHSVWGICSDGHGNLVGVLIPRNGAAAWDVPYISEHTMYVCDTPQRKALGAAIMESLADAGYDHYRIQTRKDSGLTQQYLISKPLSDEAQKKYDRIKQAEEQAQAARAAKAANAAAPEPAATPAPSSSDGAEEATPASDADDLGLDDDLDLDL